MVTFDSIFGRIIGSIKDRMRQDDWAQAGAGWQSKCSCKSDQQIGEHNG